MHKASYIDILRQTRKRCSSSCWNRYWNYIGWSFSFKDQPTRVNSKNWYRDHEISAKTPTCVLIEPDGKTFSAFGYDAEKRYSSMVEEGEHDKWYYFRRFKIKLYNQDFTRDTDIEDETGKKLNAKFVFLATIRFLKDDLLKNIEIKESLTAEDIIWVLTVPAIWDDGAKQFIWEAAESAGISSNQLIIALEPEAAAIFCGFLNVEKSEHGDSLFRFKSGSKVIVVDAGGGSVDINVQEFAKNGSMKNIYKASDTDSGATKARDEYMEFLKSMLGTECIEEFKRSSMDEYKYMVRKFELTRQTVDLSKSDTPIRLKVPPVILKAHTRGKNIQDVIKESQFASKVSITEDKMMVNVSELANLSKPQFDRIVDHVSKLIDQSTIGDIAAICLVGGFSKCSFFQQAMKTKFHNHTIIVPNYQPDLAVLIGAVICGHKPELISQRVSKYTYGVEIRVPFIEHVHRESYKVRNDDGDVQCKHAFGKHITAGQCLIDEESHVTTGLFPATLSQTTACLSFYYTLDPDPMYVTGEGCHLAGKLEVTLEGTGTDRYVMVRMSYRRPAIKVEATEVATGNLHRLNIGFLS